MERPRAEPPPTQVSAASGIQVPKGVKLVIGATALVGALVASLSVFFAGRTTDTWLDGFWLEMGKAGTQIVAVGVVGGAVTWAWKEVERARADRAAEISAEKAQRRKRQQARNKALRRELDELGAMYNKVKAVRRTLRSLGFDVHQATRPGSSNVIAAEGELGPPDSHRSAGRWLSEADGASEQVAVAVRGEGRDVQTVRPPRC